MKFNVCPYSKWNLKMSKKEGDVMKDIETGLYFLSFLGIIILIIIAIKERKKWNTY